MIITFTFHLCYKKNVKDRKLESAVSVYKRGEDVRFLFFNLSLHIKLIEIRTMIQKVCRGFYAWGT